MGKTTFLLLPLIFFFSCQHSTNHSEFSLDDIPVTTPQQIASFDHIDSLYFGFVGINSMSLSNGEFVLALWDPSQLVKLDARLSQIKAMTKTGRGPGEILSTGLPTINSDNFISTFDQFQNKVLVFDENLKIANEYVPTAFDDYMVSRVFTFSNEQTIFEMASSIFSSIGKERYKVLVQYDNENEVYKDSIKIFTKPYAPIGDLLASGSGSAMAVPYSNNQFVESHPARNTLFLFDTRTNIIAEINADFDTLNTISVNLPREKLSLSEKDSLKTELSSEEWKSIEPYLPEYKAIANKMILSNNHIWLESNLDAEFTKWFILDMNGNIKKIVNLPKDSRLTHISDQHLGIRLDDVTFALFEPITDLQD